MGGSEAGSDGVSRMAGEGEHHLGVMRDVTMMIELCDTGGWVGVRGKGWRW